jgi:acetylornithine/N-succinyldiaminopimelate aminotransferase
VVALSGHLTKGLEILSAKHGMGKVRGRGLLIALDLIQPTGSAIVGAALDAGLILNAPRPDTLRFMPALNMSAGEIHQMLVILDEVMAQVVQ